MQLPNAQVAQKTHVCIDVPPYSVSVGQIKEIGKMKFGELIDFSHKDAIYKLNFGWFKFSESQTTCQIR